MYLLSRVFTLKHNFSKQVSITSTSFLFKQAMSTSTNDKPTGNILNWASKDGEFRRQQSTFRDTIEQDENAKFAAEP
jgi:putative glutathione S-transferase